MALTIPLDAIEYTKLVEKYDDRLICMRTTGAKDRWPSWTIWGVFEVVSEEPLVTRTRQLCGSGFCAKTGKFLMMLDEDFEGVSCAD